MLGDRPLWQALADGTADLGPLTDEAASALDDPEQRAAIRIFRAGYIGDVATVLGRARDRGEPVRDDVDPEEIADRLTAPLFYRYLISDQPLDEATLHRIADQVRASVLGSDDDS